MISIRKQWKEAWKYVFESKNYILFAFLAFVFAALIGYAFYDNFRFIDDIIKNLILTTKDLSGFELVLFILQNNMQTALIGMLLGVVFGFFPFMAAVSNGVVLGYVMRKVSAVAGIGEFWRLLPHGIFELPAIFISLGLGIKLGFSLFSGKKEFNQRFYESINVFLFVVIPLLIVAAIIEGTLIAWLK